MAKWIWNNLKQTADDYSVFVSEFDTDKTSLQLRISADTDYMVYVNRKLVAFGQYPCFPYAPVYDEVNIKCKKGHNEIKIVVYYCGGKTFSTYYYSGVPGLYFELKDGEKVVLESNEEILSTRYLAFKNNKRSIITPQLGWRTFYQASKDKKKIRKLEKSIVVDKSYNFSKRSNLKTVLYPHVEGKIIKKEKGHFLIDFGKEMTAYLDLDFISPKAQNILICWGEHINDGGVRYLIENRNFSTEFKARKGRNKFFYTFRRYGLRYLEVFLEEDIDINKFGLRPVYYPFKEKKYVLDDPKRQKIYDTAVYTLKCCFHEHFEDCPWREQSYYGMDSRNQMLFHYYAFKNKEHVRSALVLQCQDKREDNILCITFPANHKLCIPSYSLFLTEECYLYATLYKDDSLLEEVYDKLVSITEAFIAKVKNGVLQNFQGRYYWNFYEWVPGLDYPKKEVKSDVILNSLFILALENMDYINQRLNKPLCYQELLKNIRAACRKEFYNEKDKLFIFSKGDPKYYCLANSFACLAGLANKEECAYIAEALIHDERIIPASIALKVFMYDLLMKVDEDKYRDYILNDIDSTCNYQIEHDATTFWETALGEKDFNNAGSLCHAWCGFAIYYYNKLIK